MKDDLVMHSYQMFETTDENDFEVAMVVSCGGTNIDEDEEEWSASIGTYRGMSEAR